MKEFKIYELYNELGNIIYVGCTTQTLNRRLYEHTKVNPKITNNGKFYGQNLTINLVRTFSEDKADVAHYYEAYLKYMWGLCDDNKTMEKATYSGRVKGGKIAGKITGKNNVQSGHIYNLIEAHKKSVLAYKKNTGEFVGEYLSHCEAAKKLNCYQSHITACIKGKRKSHKGYLFKNKSS
jgi:predicted GIY-YIG superfamily endonuclease